MREICGECIHHCYDRDYDDFVCDNEDSENYEDFTGYNDTCEEWEEKDNE